MTRRTSPVSRFWFFSLSLVSLRCADVWITFIVTPDLRWEINPLVSIAGLGWSALILSNVIGTVAAVLFAYLSLPQGDALYPPESGYSQKEFISHYLFGERHSFHKIYYVVPYNKKAIVQYCGYVFVRVLTIWSLIVVLYNASVWYSESFRMVISGFRLWITIYGILVFLVLVYSLGFFRSLYAEYGLLSANR